MQNKLLGFSPLSSLKSGTDRGVPRGNVLADFLWYFLCSATKKVHEKPNRERARSAVCVTLEQQLQNPHIPHTITGGYHETWNI
jgi:hypothetical protein